MGSRWTFVLAVLGMIVVGVVVAVALDSTSPVIPLIAAFVGVALFRTHTTARRRGAATRVGSLVDRYPLQLSAQRVAPGKALQVTFSKANRKVHAEGLLCAAPGQLRFVAALEKDAGKDWAGSVDRVSVERTLAETTVRVQSPQGPAQFVVPMPPAEIEQQLAPYVPVVGTFGTS